MKNMTSHTPKIVLEDDGKKYLRHPRKALKFCMETGQAFDTSQHRRIGGWKDRPIRATRSNKQGHLMICYRGKRYYLHRLIAEAKYGDIEKGAKVLHWNDDPTDNCPANLHLGTDKINAHDRKFTRHPNPESIERYDASKDPIAGLWVSGLANVVKPVFGQDGQPIGLTPVYPVSDDAIERFSIEPNLSGHIKWVSK